MITQILLNDDDRGLSSVIHPRAGVAFQGLDIQAAVREVADDLAEHDGANDRTALVSSSAVTLTLRFYGQFRALLDEVQQYCTPSARPYLRVSDDEWSGDRIVRLRYSTSQQPIVLGTGLTRIAGYQWKAPAGVWEDAAPVTYTVPGVTAANNGLHVSVANGVSIDAVTMLDMPPSTIGADTLVNVAGSMPPPWTALLYGPCSGPALFNDSTGEALIFNDSLVLNAGEYVEIDSAARSANFLSDPDQSRLLYLNWAASSWFDLTAPGTTLIRYAPDIPSSGCAAVLTFTPRRTP